MVDAGDSKSPAARRAGSIPAPGTTDKAGSFHELPAFFLLRRNGLWLARDCGARVSVAPEGIGATLLITVQIGAAQQPYPPGHKGQWLQGGPTLPPNKLQTSCFQPPRHMAERCESSAMPMHHTDLCEGTSAQMAKRTHAERGDATAHPERRNHSPSVIDLASKYCIFKRGIYLAPAAPLIL